MKTALILLVTQGALGAFDTLWYHEWRVRLYARSDARHELVLHAARNCTYALLYAMLAWWSWQGLLAILVLALLASEIVITMSDFLEEDRTRRLPGGERVMHALIGIAFGAMLAFLLPELWSQWQAPTGIEHVEHGLLSPLLSLMSAGALAFGLRDALAARRLRRGIDPSSASSRTNAHG